jgi:hypothetical protein
MQWKPVHCAGGVDSAEVIKKNGRRYVNISGWSMLPGDGGRKTDDVYLAVKDERERESIFQVLSISRPDVNKHFGIPDGINAGFSRVLSGEMSPVTYQVRIVHVQAGQPYVCDAWSKIHLE